MEEFFWVFWTFSELKSTKFDYGMILDLIIFLEVDLFDSCVFVDMIGVFLTGSLIDLSWTLF